MSCVVVLALGAELRDARENLDEAGQALEVERGRLAAERMLKAMAPYLAPQGDLPGYMDQLKDEMREHMQTVHGESGRDPAFAAPLGPALPFAPPAR